MSAVTVPPGSERPAADGEEHRPRVGLNLFWRTFFLLAILLIGSIMAWLHTLLSLEYEPRALHTAQQIASLVNLSRAALIHADAIARVSLIKTMADQEGVRILPREPGDSYTPLDDDRFGRRMTDELVRRLGQGTVVAQVVNGERGLWIGFAINGDSNWLLLDQSRFSPASGMTWLIWLATAGALSFAGAAAIARLINRPLKQLSRAANRVREGDFAGSTLDEHALTTEIREVNLGFNRMARRLAQLEQDRVVMLAGISHDLRTPLARLRLETEMSVADADARDHMISDMAQLDAIIDKFLDYARPDHVDVGPVALGDVVASCVYAVEEHDELQIRVDIPEGLGVIAESTELARVVSNLIENARRYGKSPGTDVAEVEIAATPTRDGQQVVLTVRDHGVGVSPDVLPDLTKPFFRGDTARTSATGAGLGLSIVDKTVRRMGGTFALSNASNGGLSARIQLRRAEGKPPAPSAQNGSEKRLWRPSVKRRQLSKQ
ncbi:sensor histidine kinase [uncultured Xylophilus sp.]|uniref:sensor histidine kinase n=1 Tax=uncultured Xylophilus sp. TaxID=296832 RepID=UPI0026001F99|nr:sensor histidine kinase [uncultured Xylophilus sp.]